MLQVLGTFISTIFVLCRYGKEQQWEAESEDRFQPSHLVTRSVTGELHLSRAMGGGELVKIKGTHRSGRGAATSTNLIVGFGIFFDKVGDMVPTVFTQFLQKFQAKPEVMVFFHMRPLSVPSVSFTIIFSPSRKYTLLTSKHA